MALLTASQEPSMPQFSEATTLISGMMESLDMGFFEQVVAFMESHYENEKLMLTGMALVSNVFKIQKSHNASVITPDACGRIFAICMTYFTNPSRVIRKAACEIIGVVVSDMRYIECVAKTGMVSQMISFAMKPQETCQELLECSFDIIYRFVDHLLPEESMAVLMASLQVLAGTTEESVVEVVLPVITSLSGMMKYVENYVGLIPQIMDHMYNLYQVDELRSHVVDFFSEMCLEDGAVFTLILPQVSTLSLQFLNEYNQSENGQDVANKWLCFWEDMVVNFSEHIPSNVIEHLIQICLNIMQHNKAEDIVDMFQLSEPFLIAGNIVTVATEKWPEVMKSVILPFAISCAAHEHMCVRRAGVICMRIAVRYIESMVPDEGLLKFVMAMIQDGDHIVRYLSVKLLDTMFNRYQLPVVVPFINILFGSVTEPEETMNAAFFLLRKIAQHEAFDAHEQFIGAVCGVLSVPRKEAIINGIKCLSFCSVHNEWIGLCIQQILMMFGHVREGAFGCETLEILSYIYNTLMTIFIKNTGQIQEFSQAIVEAITDIMSRAVIGNDIGILALIIAYSGTCYLGLIPALQAAITSSVPEHLDDQEFMISLSTACVILLAVEEGKHTGFVLEILNAIRMSPHLSVKTGCIRAYTQIFHRDPLSIAVRLPHILDLVYETLKELPDCDDTETSGEIVNAMCFLLCSFFRAELTGDSRPCVFQASLAFIATVNDMPELCDEWYHGLCLFIGTFVAVMAPELAVAATQPAQAPYLRALACITEAIGL